MHEPKGVAIACEARNVAIHDIGENDVVPVRDPDGNLTELYQDEK